LTHKTFGAKLQHKKKHSASNNNNKKSRAGNDYDYDDEGDMSEDMDRGRDREEEASRAGEDHQQYQHNLLVHRNAVKMYVWLLQWLVSVEEIAFVKKGSAALPEKGRKTKKPKLEEDRSSFWEDENQRERFLSTLLHVLDLDLSRLWSGLNPEETFTSLFSKLVFQMMENTANTKCKPVKSALFLVVSALVKKYNHAYAIVNIMVDQLVRLFCFFPF
jgi:acyl carrier protein phosphodiesterase